MAFDHGNQLAKWLLLLWLCTVHTEVGGASTWGCGLRTAQQRGRCTCMKRRGIAAGRRSVDRDRQADRQADRRENIELRRMYNYLTCRST